MTLKLVIESAPHPQRMREMHHAGGDMSIGRGAECDWQIDDPDMFISRKHCIISGRDGRWTAMDASRGGVFVDGSDRPLGTGNLVALEHGTRLRLGDVVLRVEIAAATAPAQPRQTNGSAFNTDDFFARPATPPPAQPPRPETLPEPFETPRRGFDGRAAAQPAKPLSAAFDDPFTLDPLPANRPVERATEKAPTPPDSVGFGDFFGQPEVEVTRAPDPVPEPPQPERPPERPPARQTTPRLDAQFAPADSPPPPRPTSDDSALLQAFLRGAGLDPATADAADPAAMMEALGQRFRALAEGLTVLLRTRAREKGTARVAQTVIGSAAVNPLKFLATTDETVEALVTPRGPGYLEPDAAIAAAFKDLSDHQMRSWIALQTALRRMIDRFDPALFETEADKTGLMQSLLAGGRSARLWQLYTDRYRDIARAAEDRFLGDVGADFRDAYENRQKEDQK